jgi:hypothetical protein
LRKSFSSGPSGPFSPPTLSVSGFSLVTRALDRKILPRMLYAPRLSM